MAIALMRLPYLKANLSPGKRRRVVDSSLMETNLKSIERVRADLTLLFASVIWGSAFVAQRLVADEMGVMIFNGLRFGLAALALAPLYWGRTRAHPAMRWPNPQERRWAAMAGGLLFAGAALQQWGLRYTTAANAGFITGLYVVLIPLILALATRRRPQAVTLLAAGLAATGLFFLSTDGKMRLALGDALEIGGALMWALHVILVGQLSPRISILKLAVGQYLVCAVLNLALGLALEAHTLPAVPGAVWAILYTGLLSVALGYTLQLYGQRYSPPADAAIIMSGEAVFAALAGWLVLGERLSAFQLLGCALMLSGMLLAQIYPWRRVKPRPGSVV